MTVAGIPGSKQIIDRLIELTSEGKLSWRPSSTREPNSEAFKATRGHSVFTVYALRDTLYLYVRRSNGKDHRVASIHFEMFPERALSQLYHAARSQGTGLSKVVEKALEDLA